ncbi:MAG TPA: GMC family oxidoreductase N-terminal domain-containing protein, partial [Steroidobacteraceae bacterium]|nr:GMC family oxidoreductase N-terminal domain-containing protein [Steroidobacteraceae bacterium]
MKSARYDLIIVGTGFASAFFLMRYLERAPATLRVLVLERGGSDEKSWQLANRRTSSIAPNQVFHNLTPEKDWFTSPGFGGNSKCWAGGTTRMMPGDFQLKSRYGVGLDWPMSYDQLEQHYCTVEQVMLVSGPADSPMPRSRPFPLPPHRLSDPEVLLKQRFPQGWYQMSTARASVATGKRGVCCATGFCELCPIDAKFTIQNGLAWIYSDPRVTLQLHSAVDAVDTAAGVARGVSYTRNGESERAEADLVVLGASALFNPHILLRSGITHPLLGKRLHEQLPIDVTLDLAGVKSYNGSTLLSGLGYLFYEGEHRRNHAGCMIETWNSPFGYWNGALRPEPGRWSERLLLRFLFDDLPRDDNTVTVSAADPRMAEARFTDYSDYAKRGAAQVPRMIDTLASALPIERVADTQIGSTAAHIQGTVVMG